jgi:hypothetical protein
VRPEATAPKSTQSQEPQRRVFVVGVFSNMERRPWRQAHDGPSFGFCRGPTRERKEGRESKRAAYRKKPASPGRPMRVGSRKACGSCRSEWGKHIQGSCPHRSCTREKLQPPLSSPGRRAGGEKRVERMIGCGGACGDRRLCVETLFLPRPHLHRSPPSLRVPPVHRLPAPASWSSIHQVPPRRRKFRPASPRATGEPEARDPVPTVELFAHRDRGIERSPSMNRDASSDLP